MKFIHQNLILLGITIILISCTNDDSKMISPNNTPPDAFNLISVSDNSIGLAINQISFVWETAIDLDGDTITYDVYFGTDPSNIDIFFETTPNTSFLFSDRFNTCTKYYWKVIARDNNGGETECNNPFSFSTRPINISSSSVVNNASFPIRSRHQTIVYNDRMWLIAGTAKDGVTNNFMPYNDVYSTLDGDNWEEMTSAAQFSKRYGHTSLTFDNKMWVIGGNDGQLKNDVWSSTDGWNWTQETPSANFPPMMHHKSVVYNNKIWLFYDNTVWNSDDGIIWSQINSQADFMSREGYSVTTFNNEIWLVAGRTTVDDLKNDVWKTFDGINWTLVTNTAPFSPRVHHAATVFDGSLYIVGGQDQPLIGETNDIWKTNDGSSWTQITNNAFFEERLFHTALSYDNKLWVIAGAEDLYFGIGFNDVWVMD